jgi:hypothetical protein
VRPEGPIAAESCHAHLTLLSIVAFNLALAPNYYHDPRTRNFGFMNPGSHAIRPVGSLCGLKGKGGKSR